MQPSSWNPCQGRPVIRCGLVTSAIVFANLLGCGAGPGPTRFRIVATSLDERTSAIDPSAPLHVQFSLPPDDDTADSSTLLVVRGIADASLLSAANRGALSERQLLELAPGRITRNDTTLTFLPSRPLAPSALYTLVAATRLRGQGRPLEDPLVRSFTTGTLDQAAPLLSLVDPPEGASSVVRNLRRVLVRFSRDVRGVDTASLGLESEAGPLPSTIETFPCAGCYALTLTQPLAPTTAYWISATSAITDDTGRPVFDAQPPLGFATSAVLRTATPQLDSFSLVRSSGCLVVRFTSDIATDSLLCAGERCVADAERRVRHELAIALPPETPELVHFTLAARDETTAPAATYGPTPLPAASSRPLVITEILSRPLGAWPAQQFVEVWNRGAAPESLAGLWLADESGKNSLPAVTIPSQGYALIVPASYVTDNGLDPAPAADAVLARIATKALGSYGIRTTGEDVALVESDGRVISRFSTHGLTLKRGQSAVRTADCDVAAAYAAAPEEQTPTPGYR